MITTDVSTLKIHKLSKEQYERELAAGNIDENALYLTPDEEYYTEAEIDSMIAAKADKDHNHNTLYYTKDEITSKLDSKVPATRKINGISLTDDITLTASNVGAYTTSDVDKKLSGKSDTSHSHTTHLTTEIAASKNLNDFTTPGWYKCSTSANAATLTNSPTKVAFAMEVLSNAGTTQTVYEYSNSGQKIYTRNLYDGTWGSWVRVYTTTDKPTLDELGAAKATHTHQKSEITDFPTTMKNPNALTIKGAGTSVSGYDGSVAKAVDIVAGSNVTITPDATNGKITIASSYTNTDTKVTQSATDPTNQTNWRPLVIGSNSNATEGFTPSTVTDTTFTFKTLSVQPSSGTIKATTFKGTLDGNAKTATTASTANAVAWDNVTGKPSTYAPSSHNHNDIYYTETEIDGKIDTLNTAISKRYDSTISRTKNTVLAAPNGSDGAATFRKIVSDDITSLDVSKLTASGSGKIAANLLPSYVDDVIEGYLNGSKFYSTRSGTSPNFTYSGEITGETGKIYTDLATNKIYRWSGSGYVVISETLALGTTSSTAFAGNLGQQAYTHAVTNKGAAFASGLYKITTNAEGHVTAATAVAKSDITGLGIPAQDTTYSAGTGISLSGTTFSNSGVRDVTASTTKGSISVNLNGTPKNVAVYGLGSAAYTDTGAYATAGHNHDATYLKLTGGTLNGNLTMAGSAAPALKLQSTGSDSTKMFPEITLERPGYSSWKILNKQGVFVIQNNYTTAVQDSYFDVFTLNYNSGNAVAKGTVTATAFVGKLTGNADTATTATKLGSETVGSGVKLIYLNAGTATASSSTVGKSTRPVYMNAGTITQCGDSLEVGITGNAATATKATQDSAGNNIRSTYISNISVKNSTISYTKGDGTTGTIIEAMTETEINDAFTAVFGS